MELHVAFETGRGRLGGGDDRGAAGRDHLRSDTGGGARPHCDALPEWFAALTSAQHATISAEATRETLTRASHSSPSGQRSNSGGEFPTPKTRSSRRTIELGPRALTALGEQWEASVHRADANLVFGHPTLGTPIDPSKLSRGYMRPALTRAGIDKPFRPWHDLRHTALHPRGRGRQPAGLRPARGRPLAGNDHRALHLRRPGSLPWRGSAGRGAHLRVRRRRIGAYLGDTRRAAAVGKLVRRSRGAASAPPRSAARDHWQASPIGRGSPRPPGCKCAPSSRTFRRRTQRRIVSRHGGEASGPRGTSSS
jgi:hypothetical protein